jgi:ComF family protein
MIKFIKKCWCQVTFGIRSILYTILTVLLGTETCVSCGKFCRVLPLCKSCREKLANYESAGNRCKICGKPLISETELCMNCRPEEEGREMRNHVRTLTPCFPVFSYQLWRRELVYLWKGRGVRLFTPFFAGILARVFVEEFHIKDESSLRNAVIVPVPPRPGKIREKGWDQVADLCTWLEYFYELPVVHVLKRRSGMQQKKLDMAGRFENAKHSFYLSPKYEKRQVPENIILLDDVRTTGTTLETCAAILKQIGAHDVRAVVLFGGVK